MFRVIETFSGIGSQAKALERLSERKKIKFDIVNTVEWDINAILAYCMIHKQSINTDKYKKISDDNINDFLKSVTLSMDGKNPMMEKALDRLPIDFKRKIYAAIKNTNNLVSITDVHGKDIPQDIDLFTYSFPCQDLSLCGAWHGNKSGIARNANNRSGMLWEVERILLEMKTLHRKPPRFLVMENVVNILSRTNEKDFKEWKDTLEDIGYYNKIYRLNAKKFGVPQNRERAYMVSVFCGQDEKIRKNIEDYFLKNDLENDKIIKTIKHRNIALKKILKTKYDGKNIKYKEEADLCNPNNTPSRKEIRKDNVMLYDGKEFKKVVSTVTTKQDRNPNSGLIIYNQHKRGKANWRYLLPRECFMLMGFDESDFDKVISYNPQLTKNRKLYSTEKLIKLAGNSIVVDVLEAIFMQIININKKIINAK